MASRRKRSDPRPKKEGSRGGGSVGRWEQLGNDFPEDWDDLPGHRRIKHLFRTRGPERANLYKLVHTQPDKLLDLKSEDYHEFVARYLIPHRDEKHMRNVLGPRLSRSFFAEARSLLAPSLEKRLDPSTREGKQTLSALILASQFDAREAEQSFKVLSSVCRESEPEWWFHYYPKAIIGMIRAHSEFGRFDRAWELYQVFLDFVPSDSWTLNPLVIIAAIEACAKANKVERAIKLFDDLPAESRADSKISLAMAEAVSRDFHLCHLGLSYLENSTPSSTVLCAGLRTLKTDGSVERAKRFWYNVVVSNGVEPTYHAKYEMMNVFARGCWELHRRRRKDTAFMEEAVFETTGKRISLLESLLEEKTGNVIDRETVLNEKSVNYVEDDLDRALADLKNVEKGVLKTPDEISDVDDRPYDRFDPTPDFTEYLEKVKTMHHEDASYLYALEKMYAPFAELDESNDDSIVDGDDANEKVDEDRIEAIIAQAEEFEKTVMNGDGKHLLVKVYASAYRLDRMEKAFLEHCAEDPASVQRVVAAFSRTQRLEKAKEYHAKLMRFERFDPMEADGSLVHACVKNDDLAGATEILQFRHDRGLKPLHARRTRTYVRAMESIGMPLPEFVKADLGDKWRSKEAVGARRRAISKNRDAKRNRAWTVSKFGTRSRKNTQYAHNAPPVRNEAIEEKDRLDVGYVDRDFKDLRKPPTSVSKKRLYDGGAVR